MIQQFIVRLFLRWKGIFIHRTSLIGSLSIGKKTRIWAFVNISSSVQIGENCNICDRCFIENNVKIGNNVTIKTGVSLWSGVYIEDNVFVGPGVQFCNDKMPKSKQNVDHLPTTLQEGCSIGAGSTILPGIIIGKNAMIGAGSVVTKDIPDNVIAYGNPCNVKKKLIP